MEIKVIIKNEVNDKIRRRINSDNACYYSGRRHIIPSSFGKTVDEKALIVFYDGSTCPSSHNFHFAIVII
jgi:hypothetical protein